MDGATTLSIPRQLKDLTGVTHLVMSVGGNDALGDVSVLGARVGRVGDGLHVIELIRKKFQTQYIKALEMLCQTGLRAVVCTIYDRVPILREPQRAALACFNDVITREAFLARVPVLDLRLLCREFTDYSKVSPIEPSDKGGNKIALAISQIVTAHDFSRGQSTIYGAPDGS
jgi:hypothetical protein